MGKTNGHVLIVDTDSELLALCREVAAQLGIVAHTFSSVLHASTCAHRQQFNRVLIGTWLPFAESLALLEQVRSTDPNVPIVLLASHMAEPLVTETAHLGIQGIYIKPIEPSSVRHLFAGIVPAPVMSPLELISKESDLFRSSLQKVYDSITETARLAVQANRVMLFIWNRTSRQELKFVSLAGEPFHIQVGRRVEPAELISNRIDSQRHSAWYGPEEEDEVIRRLVTIPLQNDDQPLGVLQAERIEPAFPFSTEDQELLYLLANQAVASIQNVQIRNMPQPHTERLASLYRIQAAIAASSSLDDLTATLLQEISGTLPIHAAEIVLVNPHTAIARARSWRAGQLGVFEEVPIPLPETFQATILASSTPQILAVDSQSDKTKSAPQLHERLGVPLRSDHYSRGLLVLSGKAGYHFHQDDVAFISAIAVPLVLATEKIHLRTAFKRRNHPFIEYANDAVLLLNASGEHILDANYSMEQLAGYERAELQALRPDQLFADWSTSSYLTQSASHQPFETLLRAHNATNIPVSIGVSRVPYDSGHILLLIVRDISESQRVAQQVVQNEKLAAIGRLAASIAHEVNNPLQAIYNSLNLLRKNHMEDEKRQRYLDMTFAEAERLIGIVHRLIDFHRPSQDGMRPTHVPELLDGLLDHLDEQIGERGVTVVRDWQVPLPRVKAVGSHLKQVCTNLVLNALDSMPDGGTLTIRVHQQEDGAAASRQFIIQGTKQVLVVEFSDTGYGIAPDELHKVFEPFYTTKMTGTGLGLAMSYNIIQQHGGNITVSSAPGQGTTFKITLPTLE